MSDTPRNFSTDRSPRLSILSRDARPSRRSPSSRSESRYKSVTRSPPIDRTPGRRSGNRFTSQSRSRTRSYSRSRSQDSRLRGEDDYSRSPSPSVVLPRSSKIVVEKLTKNVSESHIYEIFGEFGVIQSLDLPMNKAFLTNRGTAYILYHDPADAEAAIAHMHEAQLDGAVLSVSIVLPRRAFSRSPPPQSQRKRGSFSRQGHGRGQLLDSRASRRSPFQQRQTSPRRARRSRPMDRHDIYRPRSPSRSRSLRRSRSYSRTPSVSPRRRMTHSRGNSRPRRRRSPSYSSYEYSSCSDRSRSPSLNRARY
ncbi:RNA-binding protein with serine-rich domain 1 [Aspergillus saccharolyticus JOP 1030-1]|uniref:RNA-binding domain-containing protein n=1 Tax=Aspergillus saccharolyticus JOP 1030-1 TaxID=1450539 RepID=A0A318ZLG4_9EURO|nr:RNA-binding domain-containing protein [Aspergillus saccharolyticus JOP 1030-1]PYH47274.1 RNA-binding domain-containing protein [Aspergillus saccharolyticus JOP 1030-1]